MSITKFSGLLTRQVLRNIVKIPVHNFTVEIQWNGKRSSFQKINDNQVTRGNCKKYNDVIPKHRSLHSERFHSKNWLPEQRPKFEPNAAMVDYQRACQAVALNSQKLTTYVENESRSIIKELENELKINNIEYCMGLIRTSYDMGLKLRELISLDDYSGSLKRKELQVTNYQTRRAFNRLQYDAMPTVKKIGMMLNELRQEVESSTHRAEDVVTSCRSCISTQTLQKCVHSSSNEAMKILNESMKNVELKFRQVKELRDDIIWQHKRATDEVIVTYRAKMIGLTRQLDKCIKAIKSMDE